MAFPAVESLTPFSNATPGSSHNVTMPATVSAGDLLLMILAPSASSTLTVTATGWTNIGFTDRAFILVKVATGSEGGTTVAVSLGSSLSLSAQTFRISAWYGGLAGVESGHVNSVGASALCDHPSLTASWGIADTLWLALAGGSANDSAVTVYPTSYTDGTNTVSGAGDGSGCQVASSRRELAAATDNPSATQVFPTQVNRSYTVAIRPAAAAAGNPWYYYAQQRVRTDRLTRWWQQRGVLWTPRYAEEGL